MALQAILETVDVAGETLPNTISVVEGLLFCSLLTSLPGSFGTAIDVAFPQTCYTNSTELLFAAMAIYHLRIIERLWGSRKFAVSYPSAPPRPTFTLNND